MATLNVLLIHLAADEVDEHLRSLRAIAPDSRFVVCYGGSRDDFERIREPEKAFVADPSWRGPPRSYQSYNEILAIVNDRWLTPEPQFEACYLFEFDHLILRPSFEPALSDLAARTGAGLLAKNCGVVNGTNWHHYTRFRRDAALLGHLQALSVRDDHARMFGVMASGLWLTRAAVESYVAVRDHPRCYGELYVPTLLYHLGHRVVDIDSVSRLYENVRWEPDHDAEEVQRLRSQGATFVHPVKDETVRRRALTSARPPTPR
jgi:hypothetical protein